MSMRLDEFGENFESLKTKVTSYSSNKAEQSREGPADSSGPLDVDSVSGTERDDEDWQDVDAIQRSVRCYNCGLMGHIARDCRGRDQGKGTGKDGGKWYTKGKGKAGSGNKDGGKFGGYKSQGGRYQGQCWTCGNIGHKASECGWGVADIDEQDTECQQSGGQPESEEDGEVGSVWIVGHVEELVQEEEGTGRPGCRSKCWAHEDQRDELSKFREDRRDGLSKIHAGQADECSTKRNSCKNRKRT